jgi:hypothetical protein
VHAPAEDASDDMNGIIFMKNRNMYSINLLHDHMKPLVDFSAIIVYFETGSWEQEFR